MPRRRTLPFPGCRRRKKLHAHHVVFWSDGGRTDLSNLVDSELFYAHGGSP